MLQHEILEDKRVVIVRPLGPLQASDFKDLTVDVDAFIQAHGPLAGLMIHSESFPGWEDFAALVSHLKFVRDHHRLIRRVAAVTDNSFLSVMPCIANHFVGAEVRHFDFADRDAALEWLSEASTPTLHN